jgi:hypothetical protein
MGGIFAVSVYSNEFLASRCALRFEVDGVVQLIEYVLEIEVLRL